jgi:hypothetical protein
MREMKIGASRGDFYAAVTVSLNGNSHFVQFVKRDEAHAFAIQLRAAADTIDPDKPMARGAENEERR